MNFPYTKFLENTLQVPFEVVEVVKTIYSQVWKVTTQTQIYYLKKNPQCFQHEIHIMQLFKQHSFQSVAEITAYDIKENILLTKSCGDTSLSDRLINQDKNAIALCDKLIKQYADIQIKSHQLTKQLRAVGLNILTAKQCMESLQFVKNHSFFQDLKIPEINEVELEKDLNKILQCHDLFTLAHNDLQDRNVVCHGDELTIIDWSEVELSHPFFSGILCVGKISAKRGLDLTQKNALRQTYFLALQKFFEFDNLEEQVLLADKTLSFYYLHHLVPLIKIVAKTDPYFQNIKKNVLDAFTNNWYVI